jgi:hypothetical protein
VIQEGKNHRGSTIRDCGSSTRNIYGNQRKCLTFQAGSIVFKATHRFLQCIQDINFTQGISLWIHNWKKIRKGIGLSDEEPGFRGW